MDREHLIEFAKEKVKRYPELRSSIIDTVQMALSEIDDGESEANEVDLAINEINAEIAELQM